jgi:hypothetical protein
MPQTSNIMLITSSSTILFGFYANNFDSDAIYVMNGAHGQCVQCDNVVSATLNP